MPALFTTDYSLFTETALVVLIILAALTFAAVSIFKKRKSFSARHGCDTDCGCGK
jgi:cell division protein FtsL